MAGWQYAEEQFRDVSPYIGQASHTVFQFPYFFFSFFCPSQYAVFFQYGSIFVEFYVRVHVFS